MDVSADMIGMVKINTKEFCKESIDNLKKYWMVGYYLVLRSNHMVPEGRTLISIGYKYNATKVLYFIVTADVGSTK